MKSKGFTFIEVVVSVALLLVVIVSAYHGYAMVSKVVAHSHFRMTAADLANEQFELIKNMPYASVGTVGGTPSGIVLASQVLSRGGVSYAVLITVQNVNDPFDGMVEGFPADYKLIEVSIACETCQNFNPIVITGRVAPANLESS